MKMKRKEKKRKEKKSRRLATPPDGIIIAAIKLRSARDAPLMVRCFAVSYEKMSEGFSGIRHRASGTSLAEKQKLPWRLETNPEQRQLYLAIQVTRSHQLTLIRPFSTQSEAGSKVQCGLVSKY